MTGGASLEVVALAQRSAAPPQSLAAPGQGRSPRLSTGPRRKPTPSVLGRRSWVFLVIPGLFIAATAIYPFAQLVRMSLSNVGAENIIGSWSFIGTANFQHVLSSSGFWQSVRISAIFTFVLLGADLVLGFVTALWLMQPLKGAALAQSLMVLGWALPPIVSGTAWKFLLQPNGVVNAVLSPFGLGDLQWLASTRLALWGTLVVVAWASVPFCSVVIKAGLMGVPKDTVEASRVDGATDLQTVLHIVIPQLRNLLATLGVLIVVYGFGGSFSFIFVLTAGGPGTSTTTLPYLGYTDAFTDFDFGVGAAIAVISMVVVGALALGYLRASGREGSLT